MTEILKRALYLTVVVIGLNSAFAQNPFIEGNSLSDRIYNSDIVATNYLFVTDFTVTEPGTLHYILTWGENSGGGIQGIGEKFNAYVLRPTGSNLQVMAETPQNTVANVGLNIFPAPPFELQVGDVIAHYGRGIPLTTGTGGPSVVYGNQGVIPQPSVGEFLTLPDATYPLYNDGGRNYAIAISIGPILELNIATSNQAVVLTWPATNTSPLLQATNLVGAPWTTNTSYTATNGTNFLIIPAPVGNMFFRLTN